MKKPILILQVIIVSLLFFNCETEKVTIDEADSSLQETSIDKKKMVFDLIDLMKDTQFSSKVLHTLQEDTSPGIKLSTLLDQQPPKAIDNSAYQSLKKVVDGLDTKIKNREFPDTIEIPELWLQQPAHKAFDHKSLLISFAPDGDEKNWSTIEAYTMDKQVVYLDPIDIPDVPVLVLETKGYETLKLEVDYMNQELQNSNLQNSRFLSKNMDLTPTSKANNGLETTKLDKIRLNNDEEPWISGAAEVYAITSGIKNAGNDPEIKIIPMYYLDKDGVDYYPNQIMLFWEDYQYQAANIQLFEKDDNTNYKDFISSIINGVFQIIGTVTTQPWVNVLGQVASAILQAMPDQWFVNNDDYLDSFYTIQKNKTYVNHYGAAGNARVTLSPLFIPDNNN